jgi:hypothetical protein
MSCHCCCAQVYSAESFEADFELLFCNAMAYNQEGSVVYNDALLMSKELQRRLAKVVAVVGEGREGANSGIVS